MRRWLLTLTLLTTPLLAFNPEPFLHSIRDVEGATDAHPLGQHGERGPYQFKYTTWHQYTSADFSYAFDRDRSDRVARAHLRWILRYLKQHHLPDTAYEAALAWKIGASAAATGRATALDRSYAERVEALTESYSLPDNPFIIYDHYVEPRP